MKNKIFAKIVLALVVINLCGCGTLYQSTIQSTLKESSPTDMMLALVPKTPHISKTQSVSGWERLMKIGSGREVLISLTDGTLRGGQILNVNSNDIILRAAGNPVTIARTNIALVTVKGSSNAVAGGIIGFLTSGIALTAMICEECPREGVVLGISFLGLPGGLLGALIGS